MDSGFDDLLAPSRSFLEQNPFEDPFAKPRSSSPDPWSSFGQQQSLSAHPDIDYFKSGFEDHPGATQVAEESYLASDYGRSEHNSVAAPADPLDAATITAEDHEDEENASHSEAHSDATSSRTPGFRISTSSAEESTQLAEPESQSPNHDTVPSVSPADEAGPGVTSLLHVESPFPREPISSAYTSPERAVVSPLDQQPPPSNIDRAFASLALGGESYGGWQAGWGSHDDAATATSVSTPIATTNNDDDDIDDDDDDDDTPIGQTARFRNAGSQPSGSPAPSKRSEGTIPPLFVISVEDPQKVGDPIRAHTLYTVHTRTSSPLFSKATFSVLRRYSDFLWLYETLSMNNPGVVVPPAPEKNPFGRFDEQFIQQRRSALEKCIQKIANHPVLCKDPDLKFFLENDNFALDIKQRKAEMAHEKGGLMASIGQTLAGPRFHETDEWFDRQRAYLDGLESQLRGLVKSVDIVAKQRAELASATGEFATAVAELSASGIGEQLQQSLGVLANVERAVAETQNTQSQQDMMTLMSTADEYSRLVNSVRLAFNSRVRTYVHWQNVEVEVRRVRQIHERARAQGRLPAERVGHTVTLVAEAERRALDAKRDFEQCSKLIKSEMARFEQERIDDFKEALQTFLNGMISRQKEVISAWENYQQTLLKRATGGVAA